MELFGHRQGESVRGPKQRPKRVLQSTYSLGGLIERLADLVSLPFAGRSNRPEDRLLTVSSNQEAWGYFFAERLHDTRRVRLEHFHLFEWFPVSPGKFHSPGARSYRENALQNLQVAPDGSTYFDPYGKANMLEGGVGALRLRPRKIDEEPHYFMTASSSGVCHEGFPVLVPRRFYGSLKRCIATRGATPVNLEGEMRYVSEELATIFGNRRDIPLLYLHVEGVEQLPRPRRGILGYEVSVAVSFLGEFEGQRSQYVTFATFDPASRRGLESSCAWLEEFYVREKYQGAVVTDFDEMVPRFPQAVFGLSKLMEGRLDLAGTGTFLQSISAFGETYQKIDPRYTGLYAVYAQKVVIASGDGAIAIGGDVTSSTLSTDSAVPE
ncbi:hypothetical protein [Gloeobacter morelensis]|uniref:Uncharacterized protein n=1 Tax=Gloeobacter morelensis MG652769 TaxID=2781736 RepID=A0ABY3PRX4_9CYAN|nr:hypothetical protein [Gloeobacter morelensis]UFP96435.1 hypothetical protein ISF26_09580 [Gloeobacter morelensis MG652769]